MKRSPEALEAYLHAHVPLSAAMRLRVRALDADSLTLAVPLAGNTNPHGTVFGGSISALALLSCWSLIHLRLSASGHACELIVHRNSTEYSAPVTGDCEARAMLEQPEDWPRFTRQLEARGKARILVRCLIGRAGKACACMQAEFVAIRGGRHEEASDAS